MRLCEDLRQSVLQAAIQGKLTEQRPEDGTAEDLLKEIRAEKERLINEGKIKPGKPLKPITDDDKPFDIPENWAWVRLGEIVNIVSSRRVHEADWQKKGIPFYRAREIAKLSEQGYVNNELFISEELFTLLSKSGLPSANDLMITAVGTLGKTYIVKENDKFYYKDATVLCLRNFAGIRAKYLRYSIMSNMFMKQVESNSSGTTVATLTIVRMNNYILPLPPLAEQHRIVERVDAIMSKLDELEQAENELEAIKEKFPDDMRDSLLQAAIQGKLTEQRPEDGTAEDLLKEIRAEKERLINEGKIKPEKPLKPITDDDKPFEIPENWVWVRLQTICSKIVDGDHTPPEGLKNKTEYIMLSALNVNNNSLINLDKVRYLSKETFDYEQKRINLTINDILFTIVGTLGRSCVYRGEMNVCFQRSVAILTTMINPHFLKCALDAPNVQQYMAKKSTGTAQKGFYLNQVAELLLPLPPLAEQERIVKRLDELLPLCEAMKGE